jgi:hypothetical protein
VCALVGHDAVWFGRRVKTFRRGVPFVPLTLLPTDGANLSLGCIERFKIRVLFLTVIKTSHLIFGAKRFAIRGNSVTR